MSLNYEEVESYIIKICSGLDYQYIDDSIFVFKFPSNEIKQKAILIYDRSFENAKSQGILSAEDMEALVEKRNIITQEDKNRISKLGQQLEAQEVLLGKTTRVKANQDRIKDVMKRLKKSIRDIEYKKTSKMSMCAEVKAEEERTFFICSQCTFKENEELFWASYEDAIKENRLELKDKIMLGFVKFYSGIPATVIREIARSGLWRIRYVNSIKTSDPLFGIPSTKYTTNQLNLAYWSNYYQNIYDMMPEDRPADIIIEDDDSLDAYMKSLYEERNRQDATRKHNHKRSGKLSAFDAEEVIVTRSHELYQDIEYDTPREAQKLKDRIDLKKRTRRG